MPEAPASNALCMACGLCCTGQLHDEIEVRPERANLFRSLGAAIAALEGGALGFRQPCPFHTGSACGVYDVRPFVCRDYRCALLRRYERGEIDADAAQDVVRSAKRLVPGAARARVRPNDTDAAIEAAALDVLLRKHFRRPPNEP